MIDFKIGNRADVRVRQDLPYSKAKLVEVVKPHRKISSMARLGLFMKGDPEAKKLSAEHRFIFQKPGGYSIIPEHKLEMCVLWHQPKENNVAKKNKAQKSKTVKTSTTKVIQAEGKEEVPAKLIAQSIVKISEGMDQINKAGLSRKAIVVLLKDYTGMGKSDIEAVLDGLSSLRKTYTTA